jgi:hypothetical protein
LRDVRRAATLLTGLLLLLSSGWLALSAAPAQAGRGSISSRVRQVYEQYGTIPPCRFTSPQLSAAQNAVDAYDLEYFADYIAAIQTALTLRSAGACAKKQAPAAAQPHKGRTPPQVPLPATLTSPTDSDVPVPLVLLGVFALVLSAAATALSLGGRRDAVTSGSGRWHHASAEARYRAQGAWDSVMARFGR